MLLTAGLCSQTLAAESAPGRTGEAVLKMCQGADKVKALSVMCHNYFNGFLDASEHLSGKKKPYCLGSGDKENLPAALVAWMDGHPEALKLGAGEALSRMLADRHPCAKK